MRYRSYFSIILLLFLVSFPWVISEYRWSTCNSTSNYTEGSTYSTNLKRVITDLLRSTPKSSGFNTSSHGQTPNKVYGLLQCIGNISAEKWSDCSQVANETLHDQCGNNVGGRIWMDYCFLRYDHFNFISTLDADMILLPDENELRSNTQTYKSTTSSLLSNLSDKAYNAGNKLLAVGSAIYSPSNTVYGLVQCWRDLSIKDCKQCLVTERRQLERCCSIKQGAQALSGSCTVRYEIYPFFDSAEPSSPSSTLPSPEAPSPTSETSKTKSNKKSSKTLIIILGLVGGIFLALLICLIGMRIRVKAAIFGRPVPLVTHNEERHGFSLESGLLLQEQHFIFSLEEPAEATENFDDSNKLGEGGFGVVYKGKTRDRKEIAVKKLSVRSTQGKKEFMNEVKLMGNVQHRNLVKLLGCCAEGIERLLVYEYFPNKSLNTFLFELFKRDDKSLRIGATDPDRRRELDWQKRYNIIIGIARGLLYLHEDSETKIVHRDIKANNILLDGKLNPKIADFGLARLFPDDGTQIQTRVAGTYGYMAPEYAMRGHLSVKADVYSFGVLLLEIVSGRKNTDIHFPQEIQSLLEWAWKLYNGGNVLNMVDSTLSETCRQEQALRCIHVGLLCVQADVTFRPAMSNVVMMISSSSVTLPNPTKPAFVNISHSDGPKSKSKSSSGASCEYERGKTSETSGTTTSSASVVPSVNETSITQVEGR